MNAINKGDRIECAKCGGLLAMRVGGYIAVKEGNETPSYLEIKCKARRNGVACNQLNKIIT